MSDDNAAQAAADALAAKTAAEAKTNDSSDKDTFPRSYVEELRKENAEYRTRAKSAEDTAKATSDAAVKAANDKADAATLLAKTASISAAVTISAAHLGFADPDDAVKLMDASKVTYEDGKVSGVDEALKALSTAKPHLLGSRAAGDGTDKKHDKKPSDMNAAIRKQVAHS